MTDTAITAAAATKIIARAKRLGWKDGMILDDLGVSEATIRHWERVPDAVPQTRTREALAKLASRLDRAERRKEGAR